MARPRKDQARDIRAGAVEATLDQLAEDPDGLSLAAIAGRIGCSAPALYAHFTGKDDLLDEARNRASADMMAAKRARFAGVTGSPLDRLCDGGRDYVGFAEANPALYRLVFAPAHRAGGLSLDDATIAPLAAGVRDAQAQGHAAGADADEVARMMWFTVHGAIMMALDHQLPGPDAARWQSAYAAVDTMIALLSSHSEKD